MNGRRANSVWTDVWRCAALALAYAVSGKLALLMAIPPGYATAFWPAAGLALAAILLYGYRLWPGIVLGSFLVNIWTSFDASNPSLAFRAVAVAVAIGAGAALQAVVGAALIRRFVGMPAPLLTGRDVAGFMLLGGPAACLINATVGVTTLSLAGLNPWSNYLYSWCTWWVGDTIGVLTLVPLVFIAAAQPREVWARRRVSVAVPLIITMTLAVALFVLTSRWGQNRLEAEFRQRVTVTAPVSENAPTLEYLAAHRSWHPWMVLAAGLLFTALLGIFMLVISGRGILDAQRSAELASANAMLQGVIRRQQTAEEALKRSNNELRERNAEMEQFVYTVSHDLKSPLATIVGFLSILKKDMAAAWTDQALQSLDHIVRAADRLGHIIRDLLELSRIARVRGEPRDIDTTTLVRELADSLQLRLEECGAVVAVQRDMPRVFIEPARLWQVFENLLTNAMTYGCNGRPSSIEVGARVDGSENLFFVRDHGPGIASEFHERIFGLFQRLHTDDRGTGIGLSIVKRIVDLEGGRCWVESEPGQGAAFYFTLPVRSLQLG